MTEGSGNPPGGERAESGEDILSGLVADQVGAILAYWDKDLICRFANSAYKEWFGINPSDMVGKMTLPELLGPGLFEKNQSHILAALRGAKQVFERELLLPNGETRHTIASYYPNVAEGEVRGFFVHVADVTPVKLLEERLRQFERDKKREVVRSIIATREKEREIIAIDLRDNINQTLAYCKMMLQNEGSKEPRNDFFNQVSNYIHLAIHQLNTLSDNLSPSFIEYIGFRQGLGDYLVDFRTQHNRSIYFYCENSELEDLPIADKISIFRFVQDYLALVVKDPAARNISIRIEYVDHHIHLCLCHNDPDFVLPRMTQEFADIQNRVEYYEGEIRELQRDGEAVFQIDYFVH